MLARLFFFRKTGIGDERDSKNSVRRRYRLGETVGHRGGESGGREGVGGIVQWPESTKPMLEIMPLVARAEKIATWLSRHMHFSLFFCFSRFAISPRLIDRSYRSGLAYLSPLSGNIPRAGGICRVASDSEENSSQLSSILTDHIYECSSKLPYPRFAR